MCEACVQSSTLANLSKIAFVFLFVFIVVMYNYAIISSSLELRAIRLSKIEYQTDSNMIVQPPPGYLVWTNSCQIADMEPLTPDLMTWFSPNNYNLCSDELPLTKVVFDMNSRSHILQKLDDEISCCYHSISSADNSDIENGYTLGNCVPFNQNYVLPSDADNVIISCKSNKTGNEIQRDAYCLVQEKPEVRQRLQYFENNAIGIRPISVLMLGIDSISRFNLRRKMPKTTDLLQKDGWFELSGYNKIDDNTFSNLMAILCGYNKPNASAEDLQNCDSIWNLFKRNGYVTAYAEDLANKTTTNYTLKDFKNSSIDYNLRPSMLNIEKSFKNDINKTFCLGLRHSAEYVFDYALEIATRYRNEPYFGLFWANTFSRNSFEDMSYVDSRVAMYLKELKQRGIVDDSVVIFFSDHGSRFNNQGFLDERLPFIFLWMPTWFRAKHQEIVQAIKVNQYQLTNGYDIHMTLKHILELSERTENLPHTRGWSNFQSLFVPISRQRSCKDIAIDDHWCACERYENVEASKPEFVKAVRELLLALTINLRSRNYIPPCHRLELKSIDNVQKKVIREQEKLHASYTETYRIRFTVFYARAKFEAVLALPKGPDASYEIIGSVNRLDNYEATSKCIHNKKMKKYCICDLEYLLIKSFQDRYFNTLNNMQF